MDHIQNGHRKNTDTIKITINMSEYALKINKYWLQK